jgi:hypothetical protein
MKLKLKDLSLIAGCLFCAITLAAAASGTPPTFGTQLVPFFDPYGNELVSRNGEPLDGVLNRFFDTHNDRINWQLMTQQLQPFTAYDLWLEGVNDGGDEFVWWVGRRVSTARGDLNGSGIVYENTPLGPAEGSFTDSRAEANLVIRTLSGVTLQTASFPAF